MCAPNTGTLFITQPASKMKGATMAERQEFTTATMQYALARQKNRCASCGTKISALGNAGRSTHKYGEVAHAHHVVPTANFGGTASPSNCVIICQSCHYSAHEGGRYVTGTVVGRKKDFCYFNG
jgi:5-methylcytosine-specific restriction endonuclease McrA